MADKIVTNWLGMPIARESTVDGKTTVTTWTGSLLGFTTAAGTFTPIGTPVSRQPETGLLFPKK